MRNSHVPNKKNAADAVTHMHLSSASVSRAADRRRYDLAQREKWRSHGHMLLALRN